MQAWLVPGFAHMPPSGLMVIKKVLIMSTLASKHPAFPALLTASLRGPPSPVPGRHLLTVGIVLDSLPLSPPSSGQLPSWKC